MLEVAKPIQFDALVRPACISMNSEDDANGHKPIRDGQMATVSGWGWTNEDQEIGNFKFVYLKSNILFKFRVYL